MSDREHSPPAGRPVEALVYGVNAALAVASHRPAAIRRVLYDASRRHDLGPLLKVTAAGRRPYREVPTEDLARVARSQHHEGVVVVTDPLPALDLEGFLRRLQPGAVFLALDGVGNPHNLGAILRSAAWFGAAGVLLPERGVGLSAAAMRVAQGGAEVVPCVEVPDMADAVELLMARGISVVAADQHAEAVIFDRPPPRPLCVVMGSEGDGLSGTVSAVIRHRVRIPGPGNGVESLNVAVSAAIVLAATLGRDPG